MEQPSLKTLIELINNAAKRLGERIEPHLDDLKYELEYWHITFSLHVNRTMPDQMRTCWSRIANADPRDFESLSSIYYNTVYRELRIIHDTNQRNYDDGVDIFEAEIMPYVESACQVVNAYFKRINDLGYYISDDDITHIKACHKMHVVDKIENIKSKYRIVMPECVHRLTDCVDEIYKLVSDPTYADIPNLTTQKLYDLRNSSKIACVTKCVSPHKLEQSSVNIMPVCADNANDSSFSKIICDVDTTSHSKHVIGSIVFRNSASFHPKHARFKSFKSHQNVLFHPKHARFKSLIRLGLYQYVLFHPKHGRFKLYSPSSVQILHNF